MGAVSMRSSECGGRGGGGGGFYVGGWVGGGGEGRTQEIPKCNSLQLSE